MGLEFSCASQLFVMWPLDEIQGLEFRKVSS